MSSPPALGGRPLARDAALVRPLEAIIDRARAQSAAARGEGELESTWERWALDPFAMLDDGVVHIYSRDWDGRVPLEAFGYQRRCVSHWVDLEHLASARRLRFRDVLVEKSRQLGMTWIFAYAVWWAIVFHDVQGLVLAQKMNDVDDGGEANTWGSFFGKVRYLHENGPTLVSSRVELDFKHGPPALITRVGAEDSAFVLGEGATQSPGRGRTLKFALLDEAARIAFDVPVMKAVRLACPSGKALLSTPWGIGNEFYRLRKRSSPGWRIERVHWTEHPLYGEGAHVSGAEPATCAACRLALDAEARGADPASVEGAHRYLGRLVSPWYDRTVVDMTDEEIAEELDIDYTAALPGRVYREWDQGRHTVRGAVAIDTALGVELAFDYGLDCTSVVICQDAPSELRVIGELEVADQTPGQVAESLRGVLLQLGAHPRMIEPSWTRAMLSYGDPAGEARSLTTGRSVVQDYVAAGFVINSKPRSVATTINSVKRLLRGYPKPLVVAIDQCPNFVEHAGANRWPTDANGLRVRSAAPLDDRHNHAMRAFAYYVAAKWPAPVELDEGEVVADHLLDDAPTNTGLDYGMSL